MLGDNGRPETVWVTENPLNPDRLQIDDSTGYYPAGTNVVEAVQDLSVRMAAVEPPRRPHVRHLVAAYPDLADD